MLSGVYTGTTENNQNAVPSVSIQRPFGGGTSDLSLMMPMSMIEESKIDHSDLGDFSIHAAQIIN